MEIKHTVETLATPVQIWQVLQDVENWKSWDSGTEFSRLDGPFQVGTTGVLKPVNGPELETVLMEVEPCKRFVQEAALSLAKVVMTHTIVECGDKRQVTFQVEFQGVMGYAYACSLGPSIKKKLPQEMAEMVKKALATTLKS